MIRRTLKITNHRRYTRMGNPVAWTISEWYKAYLPISYTERRILKFL